MKDKEIKEALDEIEKEAEEIEIQNDESPQLQGDGNEPEEELEDAYGNLEKEFNELNERFLRVSSDFRNFKKRAEKEKKDIYSYANEKIICDILPVMDNFERAILSVESENASSEKMLRGIEMVFKQLNDVLNLNGIEKIDAVGKPFDPNFHHAVMVEETEDFDTETVIEVFQTGYSLNKKVIRPSMVKVSK
ncbi:MAG: nucleotide exchange factor GrpE [Peptostreptococcaceae bacterium]|nr:nucleotide exchange factor GrpE [Peptostreptococcaceae bacterium]